MPASNEFQKLSESVAAKFLQTVVVVDDQPIYRRNTPTVVKPPKTRKPTSSKNLVKQPSSEGTKDENSGERILVDTLANLKTNDTTPSKASEASNIISTQELPKQDAVSTPLNGENEAITTTTITDSFHELNVQELISLFAERGLVCSVLSPEEDELSGISQKVVTIARNADLVILDWVLYKSIGDTTIQIIQGIIDSDEEYDGRLRTIVIYTGENDIYAIARKINTAIGGQLNTDGDECSIEKNGTVRIAVFTKDHVNIPPQHINRKVSLQELPDKLIAEFSKITSGLVSNVALDSLATLRSNTHLLLSRLNSSIDIPFLSHRALLPCPDDSAEHLVDLVASEIRSLLDEYEVERNANFDVVKKWLESRPESQIYSLQNLDKPLLLSDIIELLREGLNIWTIPGMSVDPKKQESKKRDIHKHISQIFNQDNNQNTLDAEFAILTSLGRHHSTIRGDRNKFKLTLGTILEKEVITGEPIDVSKYWLCIQPRCDSVRIDKKRFFPLLPLEEVTGDKKFSFVIRNLDGNIIRLKLLDSVYHMRMECFESDQNDGGAVIAKQEVLAIEDESTSPHLNKKFYFFKSIEEVKYRWIAELKRDHAQRVAQSFASKLARVGLNESEWLRRWST